MEEEEEAVPEEATEEDELEVLEEEGRRLRDGEGINEVRSRPGRLRSMMVSSVAMVVCVCVPLCVCAPLLLSCSG